jgi:hypothetical protein
MKHDHTFNRETPQLNISTTLNVEKVIEAYYRNEGIIERSITPSSS